MRHYRFSSFFFFTDTSTTETYTLSLHDALPISLPGGCSGLRVQRPGLARRRDWPYEALCRGVCHSENGQNRSEEHTSELQSHSDLVCRLLLEKKKKKKTNKKKNSKKQIQSV